MTAKTSFDLNGLRYFAAIVDAGSITAAAQALGVTKSFLSQHLSRLETSLGARLIERTTRRMHVTALGQRFHRRCQQVLVEIDRARSLIDETRKLPRGQLKISCPVLFAQAILMRSTNSFLLKFPEIDLVLDADYREIDLLGEGYDLALRIQRQLNDSQFIVRSFPLDQHWLVASPTWLERAGLPQDPEELDGVESAFLLNDGDHASITTWELFDPKGQSRLIRHHPRLTSSDPLVLKSATLAGIGPALLPSSLCLRELASGYLARLLPQYHGGIMQLHAIYPSRDGLSRAARSFLDHLAEHLPGQIREVFSSQ